MRKAKHSIVFWFVIVLSLINPVWAKDKNPKTYRHTYYGYFDIVREFGVGYQYQLSKRISADLSVFSLYPGGALKEVIGQWDYYDFRGYGVKIAPKLHLRAINYLAPYITAESLFHDKSMMLDDKVIHTLRSVNGYGYSYGLSYGYKLNLGHIMLEVFLALGVTKAIIDIKEYSYNSAYSPTPRVYSKQTDYFHTNIGLKIGFGHKTVD